MFLKLRTALSAEQLAEGKDKAPTHPPTHPPTPTRPRLQRPRHQAGRAGRRRRGPGARQAERPSLGPERLTRCASRRRTDGGHRSWSSSLI
jgi:hypothetical protein